MMQAYNSSESLVSDLEALKAFHHAISSVEQQVQAILLNFEKEILVFFQEATPTQASKLKEAVELIRQNFDSLEDLLINTYPHVYHPQAQASLSEVLEQIQFRQALRHYALDALENIHEPCLEAYHARLKEVEDLCDKKQITACLREIYTYLNCDYVSHSFI